MVPDLIQLRWSLIESSTKKVLYVSLQKSGYTSDHWIIYLNLEKGAVLSYHQVLSGLTFTNQTVIVAAKNIVKMKAYDYSDKPCWRTFN